MSLSLKVLDEGRLVEFDEPYILLQNKTSLFTQLVEQTNQSTAASLYEVARQAYELRRENAMDGDSEAHDDEDGDLIDEDDDGAVDSFPHITVTTAEKDDETPSSSEVRNSSEDVHATEEDPLIEDGDLHENLAPQTALLLSEKHDVPPEDPEGQEENGTADLREVDYPMGNEDTGANVPQSASSTSEIQDAPSGSVEQCQENGAPDATEDDRLLDTEDGGDFESPPQVTFAGKKIAVPDSPDPGEEHDDPDASETDQLIGSEHRA